MRRVEQRKPAAVQLVAGGRGGKERAARHERSSDWPRGAQPPDPEHVTHHEPYRAPDPDELLNRNVRAPDPDHSYDQHIDGFAIEAQ